MSKRQMQVEIMELNEKLQILQAQKRELETKKVRLGDWLNPTITVSFAPLTRH